MDLVKLSPEEITEALTELPGWEYIESRPAISKKFRFKGFEEAWEFMNSVAAEADEVSHHPEFFNAYNLVEITLTTHDVGGVSDLDIDMALFMEDVAANPQTVD